MLCNGNRSINLSTRCNGNQNINVCGVYCSTIRRTRNYSSRSINTDSLTIATEYKWIKCSSARHNEYSPLYAANNFNTALLRKKITEKRDKRPLRKITFNEEKEIQTVLKRAVLEKVRSLPKTSQYNSNHTVINKVRLQISALPLHRDRNLDELALKRAKQMASHQKLEHSDANELVSKILVSTPCRRIGENICIGNSAEEIHKKIMNSRELASNRNNIFDRRFTSVGVGFATSSTGELYMCQIFKG